MTDIGLVSDTGLAYRPRINQLIGEVRVDFQPAALFDLPTLSEVLRIAGAVAGLAAVSAVAAVVAWVMAERRQSGSRPGAGSGSPGPG